MKWDDNKKAEIRGKKREDSRIMTRCEPYLQASLGAKATVRTSAVTSCPTTSPNSS